MSTTVIFQIVTEEIGGLFNLICCMYIFVGEKMDTKRCKLMVEFLLGATVLLFADAAAWYYRGDPSSLGWIAVRVSNYLVFAMTYVMAYLAMSYVEQFLEKQEKKLHAGWKIAIIACCIAGILILTVSQFTGFLYTFNEQNLYARADYFWVISILGTLVILIMFLMTLCNRKYMRPIEYVPLLLLSGVPIVTSLIQLFHYGFSLNNLGVAGAIVIMFMCYEIERSEKLVQQRNELLEQELKIARGQKLLAEQEKELLEQKTQIMLSQIKPHFMYNTLASIEAMCEVDPPRARKAIHQFSRYLRMNMNSLNKVSMIRFEKEMEYVDTYLWIEKMRFEERLNVEYDLQVKDFELPSLSLQPIVENAVKHGVCMRPDGGTVRISTRRENDEVIIRVQDDGVGFDTEAVKNDGKSHIGMKNVEERIATLCNGYLTIVSVPEKGTDVEIHIEEKD